MLFCFSTLPVSFLIPAPRGLSQKCNLQNKPGWAECTFRNAIANVCSRAALQPSGFRRFGNGVALAIHSFSNVLPQVICGQPIGRELELIQTQMAHKQMLRAEVGMRVRCANKASAEWFRRERGIGQIPRKICKKRGICGCCALRRTIKRKAREQRSS